MLAISGAVSSTATYGIRWSSLIRPQNRVRLAAVLPHDNDCAVANAKSGTEQFGYLVRERRGQRDRPAADPTSIAGAAVPLKGAGLM